MADLPTGTVTFLFTDIEGSTRLWEAHPAATRAAVERHLHMIADGVAVRHGQVFRTVGDGLCAAFATAPEAVAAALAGQQTLVTEEWGPVGSLRVRMALHTGAVEVREGDYVGACLNRLGRLLAAGHGGQVLLSEVTAGLVRGSFPDGAGLRDLGEQRFRDLSQAERVYQLLHPDLPADFPPLRSLDAYRHNLPLQLTSFVGRERELAEVSKALGGTRLLTLTGIGGCGKTRLALQLAAEALERFLDGVWLVELAALADPALMPASVAAVLSIPAQPGQSLEASLVRALRAKCMLLVLDNCEHMLDACARLADLLLRDCPGLTILATSREALGITGEASRRVPSLSLPDAAPSVDDVMRCEAVQLFVERAIAVQPAFAVTDHNAPVLAQLCRRLDGIPLALELAAARMRLLTVEQLAERLDQRFRLLTGGSRTALPRQRTLRAAVDWSYDLLDALERRLFQRVSAFTGGFTLSAAETVCSDDGIERDEVLEILARLVDKSLVQAEEQVGGGARYRLLETLRQYGREKLLASGEADVVYDRHAAYFAALVASALSDLQGGRQIEALDEQEAEDGNVRHALEWLIGRGDGNAAVRLAADRSWFWFFRSRMVEAREALQRAMALRGAAPVARARALSYLGLACWELATQPAQREAAHRCASEALALALQTGDHAAEANARLVLGYTCLDLVERSKHYGEGLALYRTLHDPFGEALLTQHSAMTAHLLGDERAGDRFLAESDRLWRDLGNTWGLGQNFWLLGKRALRRGDLSAAQAHLEEALRLREAVGFRWGVASVWRDLGLVAQARGDTATARRLMEQGVDTYRDVRLPRFLTPALVELADVLLEQGGQAHARRLLLEALQLAATAQSDEWTVSVLEVLTGAEVLAGRPDLALRYAGAAQAWREQSEHHGIYPFQQQRFTRWLAQARTALGATAADAALTVGRQLTLGHAAEEGLRDLALGAIGVVAASES